MSLPKEEVASLGLWAPGSEEGQAPACQAEGWCREARNRFLGSWGRSFKLQRPVLALSSPWAALGKRVGDSPQDGGLAANVWTRPGFLRRDGLE